jgi:hypothetical protein
MSDPERPTRKFWQFHLLTLVLMTITVGTMLLIYFSPRIEVSQKWNGGVSRSYTYGWPIELIIVEDTQREWLFRDELLATSYSAWEQFRYHSGTGTFVLAFILDLITAAGSLCLSALVPEYLIRRRKARMT